MSLNIVNSVKIFPMPSLLVQSQSGISIKILCRPLRFLLLLLVNVSAGLWP